jgi:hypothetical protein
MDAWPRQFFEPGPAISAVKVESYLAAEWRRNWKDGEVGCPGPCGQLAWSNLGSPLLKAVIRSERVSGSGLVAMDRHFFLGAE